MIALIPLFPLFGFAVNASLGRRLPKTVSGGLASLVMLAAFAVSVLTVWQLASLAPSQRVMEQTLYTWIASGDFVLDLTFRLDPLASVMILVITGIGSLIHIYSTAYMHEESDSEYARYFSYLNLFAAFMLVLVLGGNFLVLFIGWEGVGLCSYLLIGFYLDKEEAAPAAKKAFIANRVGDWGFVLGILLLFWLTSQAGAPSISFFDKAGVTSALATVGRMSFDEFTWHAIFAGGITSVAFLLFIGATGKSAQIPLFVWLPDAMAGPTPVSALIHAATMVTAGVYMVVRCSVIFTHAPTAMFTVAIIGAATALFAATIGLAQNDIKKVLAYSTISQLGYMFMACGVGAFVAAIFHVMTHAFFKAQLFLGSGSVIHGMHHEQDMRRMGGLRKYMPITWLTMCAGWLAICGIPIWSGFFSKDEILWKTWSGHIPGVPPGFNKALWFVGAVTALLTAIYMTRLMVMTFWGAERFRDQHVEHAPEGDHGHTTHKPHESPLSMTIPLIVLALLSTFGGLVGVPYALSSLTGGHPDNYFERTLQPVVSKLPGTAASESEAPAQLHWLSPPPQPIDGKPAVQPARGTNQGEPIPNPEEITQEQLFALISVLIALTGISIGWFMFKNQPLRQMPGLLENKYYVDEIYDAAVIQPILLISRDGLWKIFDLGVIDGVVHGLGRAVVNFGKQLRYMQIGFVRVYAAIILTGAIIIVGYFAYNGAHVLQFLTK